MNDATLYAFEKMWFVLELMMASLTIFFFNTDWKLTTQSYEKHTGVDYDENGKPIEVEEDITINLRDIKEQ